MANLRIKGDVSGYVDLVAPDIAGSQVINLDRLVETNSNGQIIVSTDTEHQLTVQSATSGAGGSLKVYSAGGYAYHVTQNNSREWRFGSLGGSSFTITDWSAGPTERLVIKSNGNVGIGTTDPQSTLHVNGQTRLQSSGEAGPHTYRDGNSGNDIRFFSTNGTFANPTAKTNNSAVGQIHYSGYDGAQYQQRASILATVDGNVSGGNVPMRLTFHTGTTSNLERMRIHSDGEVTMQYQPVVICQATNPGSNPTIAGNSIVSSYFNLSTTGSSSCANMYNNAGRFTIPETGNYIFSFSLMCNPPTQEANRLVVRVNGSDWSPAGGFDVIQPAHDLRGIGNNAGQSNLSASMTMPLNTNDYVELWARAGSSVGPIYFGHSWMSMVKVS